MPQWAVRPGQEECTKLSPELHSQKPWQGPAYIFVLVANHATQALESDTAPVNACWLHEGVVAATLISIPIECALAAMAALPILYNLYNEQSLPISISCVDVRSFCSDSKVVEQLHTHSPDLGEDNQVRFCTFTLGHGFCCIGMRPGRAGHAQGLEGGVGGERIGVGVWEW